jgi:hypothetical protein
MPCPDPIPGTTVASCTAGRKGHRRDAGLRQLENHFGNCAKIRSETHTKPENKAENILQGRKFQNAGW